jgi:NitT/TauT family transport system permease protein
VAEDQQQRTGERGQPREDERQRTGERGPSGVGEWQRAGERGQWARADDPRVVWAVRIGFALLVLAVWQVISARLGANFVASPAGMVTSGIAMIQSGELVRYLLPTLEVLAAGFALGVVVGVPLGLAIGRWQRLYWLSEGPINLFYTTPLVAVIPVIWVILGFGVSTKIFIVFVFVIFSVIINSAAGVRNVDGDLLELARSYGSSEWSRWREILIPSALPFILTGIRIGIGRALIGAVVAEFYAGIDGVGYLILQYSNRFNVAAALVPVVVLVALGVGSTALLKWLHRRLTPWAEEAGV